MEAQKHEMAAMKKRFAVYKDMYEAAQTSEERGNIFDHVFNRFLQRHVSFY